MILKDRDMRQVQVLAYFNVILVL